MIFSLVGCLALGYLSGSLPWGLWLGLWIRGVDVRTLGSRNLGATNVYRSLGAKLGFLTLFLDIAKGALPVLIVPSLPIAQGFPGGQEVCRMAVGFAAVAGHVWTLWAGFRGGKGVATTVGVLLAVAPQAFLVFAGVFLVTVSITRYISLGSVLGALAFAITLAILAPGAWRSPTWWFGLGGAALVILRHRENLRRIRAGTERRFSFRRQEAS